LHSSTPTPALQRARAQINDEKKALDLATAFDQLAHQVTTSLATADSSLEEISRSSPTDAAMAKKSIARLQGIADDLAADRPRVAILIAHPLGATDEAHKAHAAELDEHQRTSAERCQALVERAYGRLHEGERLEELLASVETQMSAYQGKVDEAEKVAQDTTVSADILRYTQQNLPAVEQLELVRTQLEDAKSQPVSATSADRLSVGEKALGALMLLVGSMRDELGARADESDMIAKTVADTEKDVERETAFIVKLGADKKGLRPLAEAQSDLDSLRVSGLSVEVEMFLERRNQARHDENRRREAAGGCQEAGR